MYALTNYAEIVQLITKSRKYGIRNFNCFCIFLLKEPIFCYIWNATRNKCKDAEGCLEMTKSFMYGLTNYAEIVQLITKSRKSGIRNFNCFCIFLLKERSVLSARYAVRGLCGAIIWRSTVAVMRCPSPMPPSPTRESQSTSPHWVTAGRRTFREVLCRPSVETAMACDWLQQHMETNLVF